MSSNTTPSALPHSNISIRLPRAWAEVIVKAIVESDEELNRWCSTRLVEAAAAELKVDVPAVPAPAPRLPARDRIRAAARASGMSEDAFKAMALETAIRAHLKPASSPPPPTSEATAFSEALTETLAKAGREVKARAAAKSGEYTIDLSKHTPAEAARLARQAAV